MAFTVTVQNDLYPSDQEFEILGLGAFVNGEAREVTEDQEKAFVTMYQMPMEEKIGTEGAVSASGSSSIENVQEVLGTDISDSVPPPDFSEEPPANGGETPAEEPPAPNPDTPTAPDTGGEA